MVLYLKNALSVFTTRKTYPIAKEKCYKRAFITFCVGPDSFCYSKSKTFSNFIVNFENIFTYSISW